MTYLCLALHIHSSEGKKSQSRRDAVGKLITGMIGLLVVVNLTLMIYGLLYKTVYQKIKDRLKKKQKEKQAKEEAKTDAKLQVKA